MAVASRGPAGGGLSVAQIEQLTDLMLDKLARLSYYRSPDLEPGKLSRDEIRQVIADAVILAESEDPTATLDRWMEGR